MGGRIEIDMRGDLSRLSSRFLVWWVAVLLIEMKEFRLRSKCIRVVEGGYNDFSFGCFR